MDMDEIVDKLVRKGRETYRQGVNGTSGVSLALAEASKGIVATAPELLRAKAALPDHHGLWLHPVITLTEEYVGIDRKGRVERNEPLIAAVHGGGYLTPERMDLGMHLTDDEFDRILLGGFPPLYSIEDLKKRPAKEHSFSVYAPLNLIRSGRMMRQREYVSDASVIIRSGSIDTAEIYYKRANKGGWLGNGSTLLDVDFTNPQGRFILVDSRENGMTNLSRLNNGAFAYARGSFINPAS
jgi:hypothetical protein